jgi:hypothetical protein
MATENSPPQIRTILTVAFSSIVILGALNYVFRSYFLMMTEQVEHDHLAKPEELIKLREGEQRNLNAGPLPIAKAMQELAARGRTNYAAFLSEADITPEQSTDTGPLVGWIRAPNQAALDRITAAAEANPGDSAVDGGAAPLAASVDGGGAATRAAAADGGAAAPAPAGSRPPPKAPKAPNAPPTGAPHH